MKSLRTIIGDHPLLQSMAPGHLDVLAECGQQVEWAPGQLVFRQGEPADRFFLVLEGRVALELHEPSRGDQLVQTVGKGEALGWSWLFQPFTWHFQARALERTDMICFNGAHLLIACERDHELGYDLMKRITRVLIHRLQATRRLQLQGRPALDSVVLPGAP